MSDVETDGQLLQRLGSDAAKWAAEFRKTAIKLGYSDIDEGWLIAWFANAIQNSIVTKDEEIARLGLSNAALKAECRGRAEIEDRLRAALEEIADLTKHNDPYCSEIARKALEGKA
jgi:hypothetical protein